MTALGGETPPPPDYAVIEEEYKVWKKNAPFLYDLVMTHALEFPSLTVQWFPDVVEGKDGGDDVHRLLLGTHASEGEQNYLMIAETKLPSPDAEIEARAYEDKGPVGGFGATVEKIKIVRRMKHDGEVNKARYMPQNPAIIATKSPGADVYVYDMGVSGVEDGPSYTCKGHTNEGFGLCWNPHSAGHLLSGSDDSFVCMWDINSAKKKNDVQPILKLTGHSDVVEDVAWHALKSHTFGSCSDDGSVMLWDSRGGNGSKPAGHAKEAHGGCDVNTLAFNPVNENLFVTGGADSVVNVWDMRKLNNKLHALEGEGCHTDGIITVSWLSESRLGSAAKDRRVLIWDLERIGDEQSEEDAQDGPPELLFGHGGHTDKICDFAWSTYDTDFLAASVSEDNMLQIWQVSGSLFEEEDDEVADADLEDDDIDNGNDCMPTDQPSAKRLRKDETE